MAKTAIAKSGKKEAPVVALKSNTKLARATVALYFARKVKERLAQVEENAKAVLVATKNERMEFKGLAINVKYGQTRSSFDPTKATALLKKKLTEADYREVFIRHSISAKPGTRPPKELLRQMAAYFDVTEQEVVTEDAVQELVTSSVISEKDFKEGCFSKGKPFDVLYTPTKIDAAEVKTIAFDSGLDPATLMLEG